MSYGGMRRPSASLKTRTLGKADRPAGVSITTTVSLVFRQRGESHYLLDRVDSLRRSTFRDGRMLLYNTAHRTAVVCHIWDAVL